MNVNYVPLAADAAMAGTYKNLKFKNNTDTPVYIEGTTYNRKVTFTIYGKETRASNRTIEFRSETLATYQPGADIETKDSSMLEGQTVVTQSAHVGYKAQLYKDIYIDGKKTESILVNTSTYQSSPRRVTVGTKKKEVEKPKDTTKDTTKDITKDTTKDTTKANEENKTTNDTKQDKDTNTTVEKEETSTEQKTEEKTEKETTTEATTETTTETTNKKSTNE